MEKIMNREIKFRAWDSTARRFGIFKLGDLSGYEGEGGSHVLITPRLTLSSNGIFNKDLTIQQFTGLKDKHGKEIYEGDIVEHNSWTTGSYGSKFTGEIRLGEETAGFTLFDKADGNEQILWREEQDYLVVIGNIFENPIL